jgi:hypothetical protein
MTELIGIAAVGVVAWFAAGTIWNVAKGRALMRWMQGGLAALGDRATVRWLGSTAVELVISDARAPFVAVTLVIFLEPRDMPWTWAVGRARGRRDTLIIRGALRGLPAGEFEALEAGSWSAREAVRRIPAHWGWRRDPDRGSVILRHDGTAACALADRMLALARAGGLSVRRLSVRRSEPHFQAHVGLPAIGGSARGFFESVRAVAELALG